MTKSNLADVDLKVLQFLGQDPYGNVFIKNLLVSFMLILITATCLLGMFAVYIHFDGIKTLANVLFMETAFYQFGWKMFTYRYNIAAYQKLLHIIENEFWADDKFGDIVKDKLQSSRDRAHFGVRMYRTVVAVCMPLFLLFQPLSQSSRQLPFPVHDIVDLNNTFHYVTLYAVQSVVSLYAVPFLVGFDTLFVCLVMTTINQLHMLKNAFKTLDMKGVKTEKDEQECYGKIKSYVVHHNMLLTFINDINNIHSLLMLNQFLSCALTLCGILYLLTDDEGSDYAQMTQYVLCVGCYITQLALYCVAGNEITDASLTVGDKMYESDWWVQSLPHVRQAAQMVIMRSQKPQKLTACGILDLNYVTFAGVIKTSFSFLTLLRSVSGNDESTL